MNLQEYKKSFLEDVSAMAVNEGTTEKEEFIIKVTEMLTLAEEIEDFQYLPYEVVGSNRRKVQIDGYCYNELDNYLSIFVSPTLGLTDDELETITNTEAEKLFGCARAIIEDAQFIYENGEESAPGYGLACDILNRFTDVKKYCSYLVTDMLMSKNIKEIISEDINNIPVEYHIWDINRLCQLEESSGGKENIVIDLTEFSPLGIPCLPASATEDYTAYLCNIPGTMLATLYNTYGGRLLEGNVRSFLQTKGKVNKGIRSTILNDPSMFFAYNNGIAGTAFDINVKTINGMNYITEITALQIVNGGQTTASIAMAYLNDKKDGSVESIENIYVPMKLSVVSPEKAETLVPNISRYANSQNKVSDADLWSNHPFHIRIEEFSRRIMAPATHGKQYATYWYYERANGQYRQETYKSTPQIKKKFDLQNPKAQMFNKTDLSKYMNIYRMKPHTASAGGQKSFSEFAKWISINWDKNDNNFNEGFYRKIIACCILFRSADKIVKKQEWYKSYKANIVAYTLAKIIFDVKELYPDFALDYNIIWQKQELSPSMVEQIQRTSYIMYEHLVDENRRIENVTEWAKREECWNKAKEIKIEYSQEFLKELLSKERQKEEATRDRKEQKLTKSLQPMFEVVDYGVDNWKKLYAWEMSHNVLHEVDKSFIRVAIGIEEENIPTDRQSAKILDVLNKARLEGFPG